MREKRPNMDHKKLCICTVFEQGITLWDKQCRGACRIQVFGKIVNGFQLSFIFCDKLHLRYLIEF